MTSNQTERDMYVDEDNSIANPWKWATKMILKGSVHFCYGLACTTTVPIVSLYSTQHGPL